MAKITKAKTRHHDQAMKLVNLERALTEDEVLFVLDNYNPMANHNVGKGGIFFTPKGWLANLPSWYPPRVAF